MQADPSATVSNEPRWKPLSAIPRRILGVLVEKAKTTPDNYPLSLNALTTGCNQKNNRHPLMSLSADQVEDGLEELRSMGAVAEVHGDGRVVRYRHYMKEWLGVDGVELAVMTELLLRGTQTVGELRGRAARMAAGQLPDVSTLEPVLQSLIEKKLVIAVTPQGRGQLVTHGLYLSAEMDRVLREAAQQASESPVAATAPSSVNRTAPPTNHAEASTGFSGRRDETNVAGGSSTDAAALVALQQEVAELREELSRVKKDVADLWANLG